jgi:hemerythrin
LHLRRDRNLKRLIDPALLKLPGRPADEYLSGSRPKVHPLFSFSWKNSYSVGIRALDHQHQAIMRGLNELHDEMIDGKSDDAVAPLIRNLVAVAGAHFSAEEDLMESTQFPGLADHRAKHQELTQKISEFLSRHETGDRAAYSHFLYFVRAFMTQHMLKEDHEYAPWLAEHGIR